MYYTSDVLPKSRYTHRQLEDYFWSEVGRVEYISYGSWLRAMVEQGVVVEHEESYTFDDFLKHLTVKVLYEPNHWMDDNDEWHYESEKYVYEGPVPDGKADWEPRWKRNPDPEYGEDGRLYYVGDGEWELVIWTREPYKSEE